MDARTRTRLRRFGPGARTAAVTVPAGPWAPLPASVLARLRAIAKSAAAAYGDWRPSEVTAVATSRAMALPRAAWEGAPDAPVYVVTMAGHFSGGDAHRGPHRPARRYLSLVVDARSYWVLDTALSRKAPAVPPAAPGGVAGIAW